MHIKWKNYKLIHLEKFSPSIDPKSIPLRLKNIFASCTIPASCGWNCGLKFSFDPNSWDEPPGVRSQGKGWRTGLLGLELRGEGWGIGWDTLDWGDGEIWPEGEKSISVQVDRRLDGVERLSSINLLGGYLSRGWSTSVVSKSEVWTAFSVFLRASCSVTATINIKLSYSSRQNGDK